MQVRIRVVFLITAFVLSLFAARLVQLQGVDAAAYASMAAQEGTRLVELHAERGVIRDRDGEELATSVDGVALTADPTMTADDAPEIAAVLRRVVGMDYFRTIEMLRTPDTRFVWLQRQVPMWQADRALGLLSDTGVTGVFSQRDPFRTYPAGDVAGNVLGFLDVDGTGIAGLESVADESLRGTDGSETYMVSSSGAQIPLAPSTTDDPEQGTGLELTLDRDLQWYAQRRLQQAIRETGALSGTAVVTHVGTGQVLALAESPTVDPNKPQAVGKQDRGSRAVQNVYEPGSVQKLMTFAALLDRKQVTPRTQLRVPGAMTFDGFTVGDYWEHGMLSLTATGVLSVSSNLGTIRAAENLNSRDLEPYLRSFGLGKPTDIGLPGESAGILAPSDTWSDITRANILFGQGLSVTAVQMAAAVNAVANDGVYVAPSLVAGRVAPDGTVTPAAEPQSHRVVSPRAATQLQQMMEAVTAPDGTAPAAAIPGYRVSGKTGTAQRVSDSGGYDSSATVVSFAGFTPADDPRFSMYIVLDSPDPGVGGGTGAGPIFRDVMGFALQRYAVAPSGTRAPRLATEW
ncbi:MAG: penicillin-binding protein 2 [Nocardioidaceae bacterium]|nr:penicillin-binding protein 2 [Nocardioidaceae bacterium]